MSEALDAPFWAAAADDRLVIQRCECCGSASWPPLERCGDCNGGAMAWVDAVPEGVVWSFVVYHRIFDPRLEVETPYVIVAVEHESGVCLPGRLTGSIDAVAVGASVTASFMEIDGAKTPVWTLTPAAPE